MTKPGTTRRCREFHPADAVLAALVAAGLLADVPLLRGGHESVSARAGATAPRRWAVAYIAAHFLGLIPDHLDPLHRIARRLRP